MRAFSVRVRRLRISSYLTSQSVTYKTQRKIQNHKNIIMMKQKHMQLTTCFLGGS